MAERIYALFRRTLCTLVIASGWAVLSLSDALAQVRPNPMGTRDAEIMSGREWAGYFIGGFLLLILLIALRQSQKQKQKQKQQEAKHRRHMEKMKEELRQAMAQQKPRPD